VNVDAGVDLVSCEWAFVGQRGCSQLKVVVVGAVLAASSTLEIAVANDSGEEDGALAGGAVVLDAEHGEGHHAACGDDVGDGLLCAAGRVRFAIAPWEDEGAVGAGHNYVASEAVVRKQVGLHALNWPLSCCPLRMDQRRGSLRRKGKSRFVRGADEILVQRIVDPRRWSTLRKG
jgi:hypothetical protein